MKRHCKEKHASDFKYTITSFVSAQSLLKNRFFFRVQARSTSSVLNVESEAHSVKFNNDDDV